MRTFEKVYPYLNMEVYQLLKAHPIEGIPRILAVERVYDGFLVRQEYVDGRTLTEQLTARQDRLDMGEKNYFSAEKKGGTIALSNIPRGLLTPADAVALTRILCRIVKNLHALGIVHGDIKPDNVLITDSGRICLIDFNASHMIVKKRGRDTVMLGTPGFASPEQYGFSRSDERSDVYAIGQMLNYMITGCYTQQKLTKAPVRSVIQKCTQIDPRWRYQNMDILLHDLKQYETAGHEKIKALPPGFRTRRLWKMILAAIFYVGGSWFALNLSTSGAYSATVQILAKVWYLLMFYTAAAIATNYMDINELFPFARKSLLLRGISKVLERLILAGLALFVYTVIASAFFME